MIATTPKPPYYEVIFTTIRTEIEEGYDEMAKEMEVLAKQQDGYLVSARKLLIFQVSDKKTSKTRLSKF